MLNVNVRSEKYEVKYIIPSIKGSRDQRLAFTNFDSFSKIHNKERIMI